MSSIKQFLPNGDDLIGIIHYLTIRYKNNAKNFVKTQNSSQQFDYVNWGSSDVLINYELYSSIGPSNWCSENDKDSFFILHFPKNSVKITNYTFVNRNHDKRNFPENWKVEGSNDGDDWEYIDHRIDYKELNDLGVMKTFQVNNPGKYKYFKFTQNGTNYSNQLYFTLGKVDIFGLLFGVNDKFCRCSCKRIGSIPNTLFFVQLIMCSK